MDSLCFDPMAAVYDETRTIHRRSFKAVLDLIAEKYPPAEHKNLLEPGIGTGRIGIALAARGYSVTGIDISEEMLKVLAGKLARRKKPISLAFQKADVAYLPFKDASFDIAVVVHLFHLIRDWQRAVSEVLRALKADAPLVMIGTGAGREITALNDRYRELCADCGQPARPIGMPGIPALREYLKKSGRHIEAIEDRWKWTKKVRVEEAFRHIKLRYYGMTRLVPEEIHLKVIGKLEAELKQKYGDLEREVEVPNQMKLFLVTR